MNIEVSTGEIVDKLSILQIKKNNITDNEKLINIDKEYEYLYKIVFEDLKINKGWTWELKCFYGDKIHISKIKNKKNLKNKVFEKMKRLYLIERNNQLANVKFLKFYKLKKLNKKKFLDKIIIRFSKSRNYYEVYFKSIADLEYCYGDIKEVK